MIRATTNGVLKGYRRNLNSSSLALNKARDTVLNNGRYFTSYAEDPGAASQAFKLRRAFVRTSDNLTTSDRVIRKFDSAWASMGTVVNEVDNVTENSAFAAVLRGNNDPTAGGRAALGRQLKELSESIVQTMNGQYGDTFIFSGADGMNVPFSWGENGELMYRGIPVDTEVPEIQAVDDGATPPVPLTDKNGDYIISKDMGIVSKADYDAAAPGTYNVLDNGAGGNLSFTGKDGAEYYIIADGVETISQADYDTAVKNLEKLDYLANEKNFADIGLGLKEDDSGKLIEASAYNAAISGIDFLGYGVDEDGDPKNVASIVKRMGEILTNCDQDGKFVGGEREEYERLLNKLGTTGGDLHEKHVELDARTSFLKNNHAQLTTNADTLNDQINGLERMDMAQAITSLSWAQYCYNAALKVGNSILSQSLIDYMN